MTLKKKNQIFFATLIVFIVTFCLIGCSVKKNVDENKETKKEAKPEKKVEKIIAKHKEENMKLTMELFKNSYNSKGNVVISPVAVQMGLAFIMNGAVGLTQTEIINKVGMEAPVFNNYLKTYIEESPKDVRGSVNFVNAIWLNSLNEGMDLKNGYEDRAIEYLNAQIKSEPFSSGYETVINNWIKEETDGMVNTIMKKTDPLTWLYTVNVATFAMDWANSYNVEDITKGQFKNFNNQVTNVEMMSSVESLYIEDNQVTGFIKDYYNPRYKFVAIMPDETIQLDAYVKNWDARKAKKLLEGASNENVKVTFPKFDSAATVNMRTVLMRIGLKNLYSMDANLSGLLEDGKTIELENMIHTSAVSIGKKSSEAKIFTEVDSKKADKSYTKEITINRPFLYLIYDTEEGIPLFIGSVKVLQ